MMSKKGTVIGVCLLVLMAVIGGCQQDEPLVVGLVDMKRIIEDDPEYQRLSSEYLKESVRSKQSAILKLKDASEEEKKALIQEYSALEEEFTQRWTATTNDFFTEKRAEIKDIVSEIATRKSIDIVMVNGKEDVTVEWGGVDITQDVQVKIMAGPGNLSSEDSKEHSEDTQTDVETTKSE